MITLKYYSQNYIFDFLNSFSKKKQKLLEQNDKTKLMC